MIGLEGVSRALADMLVADLPSRIEQLEQQLGPVQPYGQSPAPRLVFWTSVEVGQVPVEDYPLVVVMGRSIPKMMRTAVSPDGVDYDVTYTLRVLSMVRSEGYEATAALRSRLALAVRECLLAHQSLPPLRLDEARLRESFSDVQYDAGKESTVAGAYIDVEMLARERITPRLPAAGVNQHTTTGSQQLPGTPILVP